MASFFDGNSIENGFIVTNKDKLIFSDLDGNVMEDNLRGENINDFLSSFDVPGKDIGTYPLDSNSAVIVIGDINHSSKECDLLASMMKKVGKIPDESVVSSIVGIGYGTYSFQNNNDYSKSNSSTKSNGFSSSKVWLGFIIGGIIISSVLAGMIFYPGMNDSTLPINEIKPDTSFNSDLQPKPIKINFEPIDPNLKFLEKSTCPMENTSSVDDSLKSKNSFELIRWGNLLYDQNSYKQALVNYQLALEKNSGSIDALNGIGTIMELDKKYYESINCFYNTLKIQPTNINALNGMGNALVGLKLYEEALEFYNRSLSISKININALNGMGNVKMGLNQYDEALEFYNRSLLISSTNDNANVGIGRALTGMDNYSEAMTYFDKVLDRNSHHLNAILGKSIVFIEMGKADKARELLEPMHEIYPENNEIRFLLDKIKNS